MRGNNNRAAYSVGRHLGQRWKLALGAVIGFLVFFGWVVGHDGGARLTPAARAELQAASSAAPNAAPASEPKKAEKNYAYAYVAAKELRDTMRDPDSFKLTSAYIIKDTGNVCYEYRARNGFGGMNKGYAVLYKAGLVTSEQNARRFTAAWNKYCAHKDGIEAADLVNAYLPN